MMQRRLLACLIYCACLISAMTAQAQGSPPAIPLTLSDPYLILIPVGWQAKTPDGFGFAQVQGEGLSLGILDPISLQGYIPFKADSSPRRIVSDYYLFFYAEEISPQAIDLGLIENREYALYQSRNSPAEATAVVQLPDQSFGLVEIRANNGTLTDANFSRALDIIATMNLAPSTQRPVNIQYHDQILPSGLHRLSLPEGWQIEASAAPGQLFIVGSTSQIIVYPPDSLAAYFQFPADVNLANLARIIEKTLFDTLPDNTRIDSAEAGDRRLAAYAFRSVTVGTDTQVVLVALPDGGVAYFRAVALANGFNTQILEQIRTIALSLKPVSAAETPAIVDSRTSGIIPDSGSWRVHTRPLMRQICDGQVERLYPLPQAFQFLAEDYFETILVSPEGTSLTLNSDKLAGFFAGRNLQINTAGDYLVEGDNLLFYLHPLAPDELSGHLNIVQTNQDTGKTCRISLSLSWTWIE